MRGNKLKFNSIEPTSPTSHPKKTKRKYYNPGTGEYISYAAAHSLKKRGGPDLFKNPIDIPDGDSKEILRERLRCVNLISEVLTNIINE